MSSLPPALLERLPPTEAAALHRLASLIDTALRDVYREAVLDHQESRGDDAQLFGFKVYKHVRYALMQAVEDDGDINLIESNGAYLLRVGPLRIRVDSLGHFVHEDVLAAFPDASLTKQPLAAAMRCSSASRCQRSS